GLVYHLRRTGVEAPVVTDADGKPIDAKVLQSRVMIDAAIFSHNQIEDISVNPVAQRELLDRLCSHAIGPIAAEVETSAAGLKDNAGQLESLARKLEAAKQDLVDLSSWESKLKVANEALRDEGVPAGLQSAAEHASLRKRERACVDQVGEALARLRAHLAETLPAKIRTLATFVPEELLAGPNGAVMEELARALGRRETELEILLSPVIERVRQLEGEVSRVSETLTAAHGPQDERYRETMALAQAHGARIKVRDEAAREVERLAGVKQALLDLEAARKAAVEERTRLRDSFKAARKR
ncbi:MAG: hypothetical protein KC420_22180, partial [Myxococcales bacterium]|nr:hypothetical protein [Myxococcales bacterium]